MAPASPHQASITTYSTTCGLQSPSYCQCCELNLSKSSSTSRVTCTIHAHCLGLTDQALWYCRSAVYNALHGVAPDIKVGCTNSEMGGAHVGFQQMLDDMEHSVFCLALAGDSPSTRRLSEIFLAGAE